LTSKNVKETSMANRFHIGDKVTWTSQSSGSTVTKVGAIFEIVAAGKHPAALVGGGGVRDHESYVVKAYKVTDRKRVGTYWPIVSKLHKVLPDIFNEDTLREEIIRVWGPAGAHIDVYDALLNKVKNKCV
jgi:hypothetical protein